MKPIFDYIINESAVDKFKASLDTYYVYDKLEQTPYSKQIKKFLGDGNEGSCALLTNGRVLKIFYGLVPDRVKKVIAVQNNIPKRKNIFVHIYDDSSDWIVKDYTKTNTTACKVVWDAIKKEDETNEWYKNYLELCDELHLWNDIDLKIDNLGETKDGKVVLIDW